MTEYLANVDPFSVALWVLVVVLGVFLLYMTFLAARLLRTLGLLKERVDAALREVQLTGAKIREAADRFARSPDGAPLAKIVPPAQKEPAPANPSEKPATGQDPGSAAQAKHVTPPSKATESPPPEPPTTPPTEEG